MTSQELRQSYLDFFKSKNHHQIAPSPLVPENDPSTLFTSAGMQPLIPYLLGQPHPQGKRLVDSQPCFRSQDIEEVGDNRHTTFFEMLGNWSLGDYFKKDQLTWLWTFLTKDLKLDPARLHVTVFAGGDNLPKDEESISIWRSLGLPDDHIHEYGVDKNFWSRSGTPEAMPVGEPGGTTSEVFYEFTQIDHDPKFGDHCHPNCDCGRFLEIGNSVFMEYQKVADGSLQPLPQKNVDFGGGLERLLAAVHDQPDIFKTDLFTPIIEEIEKQTNKKYQDNNQAPMRVIADHLKAATFMIAQGLEPSNKQQGYILRRLIRRAVVKLHQLGGGLQASSLSTIADRGVLYVYQDLLDRSTVREQVFSVLNKEGEQFSKTLDRGLKQLEKLSPFDLYQTYGFPPELTEELLAQKGKKLDWKKYKQDLKKHQSTSRSTSKGMFKGGLADHSTTVTAYHTATHLLHAALRQILGEDVHQVGSNITSDRLRFDFTYPQALTDDQIQQIQDLINQQIKAALPVTKQTMSKDAALSSGALAFFRDQYADTVSVYTIGSFSREVCGGPHVNNTSELKPITIYKQESIGSGKRRLYARF